MCDGRVNKIQLIDWLIHVSTVHIKMLKFWQKFNFTLLIICYPSWTVLWSDDKLAMFFCICGFYRQDLLEGQLCRYCFYSWADFWVFRPAGATRRCTDQDEIWQWGADHSSLPNFILIGSGVWVYSPQNLKFLEFYQYNCPLRGGSPFKPRIFRFSAHVLLWFSEHRV